MPDQLVSSAQPEPLESWIRAQANQRGFCVTGICPAVTPPHYQHFCDWLDNGMAGSMDYLPERREAYSHPRHVLDGAQSVVMLGLSYYSEARIQPSTDQGNIARYAWGRADYHDWIHAQFKDWLKQLRIRYPDVNARGVVDTAPLLERDFARLAGLGWVGKNTMLINKRFGSYFFLAALLLDQPLTYDQPHVANHCGTCTRCLDACPTNAFPEPGVLDSRKCISYLTIEQRKEIPTDLREPIGDWFFGCDICQEVCPWNRHAKPSPADVFSPLEQHNPIPLLPLFELNDQQFRERFRKTPLWRSKRTGILRNAAVVLGNQKSNAAVAVFQQSLNRESDPVLIATIIWALGQIGTAAAKSVLEGLLLNEADPVKSLRGEIQTALESCK